ncbi:MAG: hypothetical protein AAF645_20165 [Myxococcota bacterium]
MRLVTERLRLDAATGTRFLARGIDPARGALDAPDALASFHRADLLAGAEALTAATFSAVNAEAFDAAIRVAFEVAQGRPVFASLSPMFDEDELARRAERARRLGARPMLETFTAPPFLLRCVRRLAGEDLVASYCPIEDVSFDVPALRAAGAAVVGVNCGTAFERGGYDRFIDEARAAVSSGPTLFRPSVGLPDAPLTVRTFADGFAQAEAAGVRWFGACCGGHDAYLEAAYGTLSTRTPGGAV